VALRMCCRIAALHSKSATRAKTASRTDQGSVTITEQSQCAETSADGGPSSRTQSPGRRLLVGSGAYAVTNFTLRAVNFLLITVFTRYLSPGDYGTISLAEIIAITLAAFGGLGLDTAVRRLYFHYSDEPSERRRYVSSVVRFGAVLTTAVVVLALILGPHLLQRIVPRFPVPFFPYIALAIGAAAANQTVDYGLGLFQSEQRPLAFSLMASASFLMTSGSALILVVLLRRGAAGMLTGKLMGAAGSLLVAIVVSRKWWTGGFEWKFVRESLPIALPILPHMLLAFGLVVADRFILEYYRDLDEVGVYSVAYTFGMVMYLVTTSISQAWSPLFYDVARSGVEGQRVLGRLFSGLSLLLVLIAIFGSLIAQDVVSHFLDRRYLSAGRLIPWVIGGYLFHALYAILQPSLLQARRAGFLWVVSCVALVANIGLNFLWIPRWGMYGAAYATTAAYVVEAALMFVYAQRVYPLAFSRSRLAAALVIFSGVLWVTQVDQQSWHLTILGLTFLSSVSVILVIGQNEFVALLGPLRRKLSGAIAGGRDDESFADTLQQPAPTTTKTFGAKGRSKNF
jgi:O-antigen/teichoic acid export membrane protein